MRVLSAQAAPARPQLCISIVKGAGHAKSAAAAWATNLAGSEPTIKHTILIRPLLAEVVPFAALTMVEIGTSFSQRALMDASEGWFLSGRRDQQTGMEPLYYGKHNLGEPRAYQIVCLMVGSDPAKFMSLADETKMPQSRQESCRKDYAKASRSWDTVLKPHRRAPDQPETRIDVAYGNAQGNLEVFARSFRAVRILETVAQAAAADFAWPAPFAMEMQSCGRSDAAWSDKTRTVRVCYELAFDFVQLYRAYVAAAPTTPASASPKRNRKSKRSVRRRQY